jgi:hypothetical protein
MAPDLLHQVMKVFKDNLMTWVEEYLDIRHGSAYADIMMDELDRQ